MADPSISNERSPLLGETRSTVDERAIPQSQERQPNGHPPQQDESQYLIPVSKARFWFIFTPILLQYFICMFDAYFMSTSHPVITSYFNASNSASWLSTAFMLTSTSFQPTFGRLSDTIGRRPVYLVALVGFIATTAWCALAQDIESFIIARAFCGIAAGGMMAMVCSPS
jgi:predicted MFS family arabinose efflux permease